MQPNRLLRGGREKSRIEAIALMLALSLVVCVFYVDAFTSVEGAIAGLYVVALLLAGPALTSRGTILMSFGCGILTLFAYGLAHGPTITVPSGMRVIVSLAALCITCALLMRNNTTHDSLIMTNQVLSESEERYRSLFEQNRIALWEWDYSSVYALLARLKDESVTDIRAYALLDPSDILDAVAGIKAIAANKAGRELFGLSEIDLLPSYLLKQLSADEDTTIGMLIAIYTKHNLFEGKCTFNGADGAAREVLMRVQFPEDPAACKRVAVAMIDITKQENSQRAIRDAHAELSEAAKVATVGTLSASIAHELNQPLGAVVLNAQTLLRWLDREPADLLAVRRSAERVIRDGKRASEIVLNARRQVNREKRTSEEFCLRELVEQTKVLMENDLHREDISLITDSAASPLRVHAVRIEVQQVLINLVSNAIQAIAGSPAIERDIHVSLEACGEDLVQLSVRDTGPGIPDGLLDQLFVPFFTTKATGMGMGLSICQNTMEAMGGRLTAANSTLGGAVFKVDIPVRATQAD